MNKSLDQIEKLKEQLGDISPENLEGVIHNSLKLFHEVLQKLQSEDPKEKEKALEMAESLRKSLQEQSEKAMEAVAMSAKELEAFTNNPDNFSQEEWEALQEAKKNLTDFQKDAKERGLVHSPSVKKAKKQKSKLWITG